MLIVLKTEHAQRVWVGYGAEWNTGRVRFAMASSLGVRYQTTTHTAESVEIMSDRRPGRGKPGEGGEVLEWRTGISTYWNRPPPLPPPLNQPPLPPLNQPPPLFPSTLTRRATRRPWRQCLNAYQRIASQPKWPRTLMCFTFSDTSELLALSQKYTQCNSPQDYGWWKQTRPVTSKGCRDLLLNVYYHSVGVHRSTRTHAHTRTNIQEMWIGHGYFLCFGVMQSGDNNNSSEALYSMNRLLARGAVQYHKHKETNIKISTMRWASTMCPHPLYSWPKIFYIFC